MLYKTLFQTFNNNNTKRRKETRTNTKEKKKIGNYISDIYLLLYQMENQKEQYKKKGENI